MMKNGKLGEAMEGFCVTLDSQNRSKTYGRAYTRHRAEEGEIQRYGDDSGYLHGIEGNCEFPG